MKTTNIVMLLALLLLFAHMAQAAQYLTINGEPSDSITLNPGQSCTFEVVSDDSNSYADDLWGFQGNTDMGSLTLQQITPEAGFDAWALDFSIPPNFYDWRIVADGTTPSPSPGTHFIFTFNAQNPGETDLYLDDENFNYPIEDSVHITVVPVKVGTAFTYQGHLYDANHAADGLYDFQFKLWRDPCSSEPLFQVGDDVNKPNVDVIDGYFTVELDLGSDVFAGDARWLEIGVRPGELNDPCVYTTLSPRQRITPTPYAIYAKTAGAGHSLDAADGSPTDAVYVDNEGNVGIGTTNPTGILDVAGGTAPEEMNGSGITIKAEDGGSSSINEEGGDGGDIILLPGAGGEGQSYHGIRGSVGIGTTNPIARLEVQDYINSPDIAIDAKTGGGAYLRFLQNNQQKASIRITGSGDLQLNSSAITILNANANVGIGMMNPTFKLDVAGDVRGNILYANRYYDRDSTGYYVDPAGTSYCNDMRVSILYDRDITSYYVDPAGTSYLNTIYAGSDYAYIFYDRDNTSYYMDPNGESTLYDLRVTDDIYAPDVYYTNVSGRSVYVSDTGRFGYLISSRRYKENIGPLEDDVAKILEAEPVSFIYKESKEHGIGLIAEDLDDLGLRDLVIYDTEGRPESVRYEFISLYLLEVVKDLKAENESLKKQLRAESQSLKQRLDALERTIQQQHFAAAKEVQQ